VERLTNSLKEATAKIWQRREVRIVIFVLLLLLLIFVASTTIYYGLRKRLPSLIPFVPRPPAYMFSMYGDKNTGSLSGPLGVAIHPSGNVFVTDPGNKRVVVFDPKGKPLFSFNKLKGEDTLQMPVYIAINKEGDVFVSDRLLGAVFIFSERGTFRTKLIPNNDEKFAWAPMALAFDKDDNLYVTDVGLQRVLVLGQGGQVKLEFWKEGMAATPKKAIGKFYFPNGITVDRKGRILVADSNNRRIQVFNQEGKFLFVIPTGGLPRGIVTDSKNQIYVVDVLGHLVKVYDEKGKFLFEVGKGGKGAGQFSFPNGLAIDKNDRLYIADRENNRIQTWGF